MPAEYAAEAKEKGISGHQLLTEKLKGYKAGKSGLIALDWFNGVRSPLMDFDLNGLILGLNLQTKPEDIYLALIEATAFDELYADYLALHEYFGKGGNDVMRRLNRLRRQ